MKQAYYVYQANLSKGEMLLANDSSSFTRPYFESAQVALKGKSSLLPWSHCLYFPSRESEDPVMRSHREAFRVSEWILPALIVDLDDQVSSVLLLERAHPEHCIVYSFQEDSATVISGGGMEIQEEEGEKMEVKEFLSTLSLPLSQPSFAPVSNSKPINLGYREDEIENEEEEEDVGPISFVKPSFEPTSKKGKAANLGFSQKIQEEEQEEEGDEDVRIQVQKEAFAPSSSKKPKNLGSSFSRPKALPQNEEEDEPEEVKIDISAKREDFAPASSKKPRNLDEPKPKYVKRPLPDVDPADAEEEEKKTEEAIASSYQKPTFEPNAQLKAPLVQSSFEKPEKPNQRRYAKEAEAVESKVEEKSEKPLPSLPTFRPSPDFEKSKTVVNDPALQFAHRVFEGRWRRMVSAFTEVEVTPESVFVEASKDDPLLSSFDASKFDILACNVDRDNEPYDYLLSEKGKREVCLAVRKEEKRLVLLCFSSIGMQIYDPSLDFASLLKLCFPEGE